MLCRGEEGTPDKESRQRATSRGRGSKLRAGRMTSTDAISRLVATSATRANTTVLCTSMPAEIALKTPKLQQTSACKPL